MAQTPITPTANTVNLFTELLDTKIRLEAAEHPHTAEQYASDLLVNGVSYFEINPKVGPSFTIEIRWDSYRMGQPDGSEVRLQYSTGRALGTLETAAVLSNLVAVNELVAKVEAFLQSNRRLA